VASGLRTACGGPGCDLTPYRAYPEELDNLPFAKKSKTKRAWPSTMMWRYPLSLKKLDHMRSNPTAFHTELARASTAWPAWVPQDVLGSFHNPHTAANRHGLLPNSLRGLTNRGHSLLSAVLTAAPDRTLREARVDRIAPWTTIEVPENGEDQPAYTLVVTPYLTISNPELSVEQTRDPTLIPSCDWSYNVNCSCGKSFEASETELRRPPGAWSAHPHATHDPELASRFNEGIDVEAKMWGAWRTMIKLPKLVPDAWAESYLQFFDDVAKPTRLSDYLSRLDRNEPHSPENTYWASEATKPRLGVSKEQRREMRREKALRKDPYADGIPVNGPMLTPPPEADPTEETEA